MFAPNKYKSILRICKNGNKMYLSYDPLKGFGTGMYLFKKVSDYAC